MSEDKVLVRTDDVYKTYGTGELETSVLHGIAFALPVGQLTLLMGPSGSGKTTFLSILAGLLRPTRNRVELCSTPISELPDSKVTEVRRRWVGFVFQHSNLFPGLTAFDNVYEALRVRGVPAREARAKASLALQRVGLAERVRHRPSQLSGGQQQRVAVARALADEPTLILGDEDPPSRSPMWIEARSSSRSKSRMPRAWQSDRRSPSCYPEARPPSGGADSCGFALGWSAERSAPRRGECARKAGCAPSGLIGNQSRTEAYRLVNAQRH
jgi:ABC-type lipoprotein export system ATPase subunit